MKNGFRYRLLRNTFSVVCFSFSLACFSQNAINGIVVSEKDQAPLIGVTVLVKGENKGVVTDFNGVFNVEASVGDILEFSYIGFKTKSLRIGRFSELKIELQEDITSLSEVVIIGYGSTTTQDATGSVVSLKQKDLNVGNIVTPENLLQGRVAGLSINSGGEPGAGSVIRIRGGSSLFASNAPLIVVDGLPIDNNAVGGSRSILSTINPDEIEAFSILKDASATAIYGSRASNGVIIITTKKGSNKLSVVLDTNTSYHTLANKVDVFNADEFRALVSRVNPSLLPYLGAANTDWQDAIYDNAISSKTNLSISGPLSKNIPVRLSLGNSVQNGLRLTSAYERNSVSLSTNPVMFDDKLKLAINANYAHERNRFAPGVEGDALTFDPTQPIYDADSPFGGFFQYHKNDKNGVLNINDLVPLAPKNPVAELLQRKNISKVERIYGNVKLDYTFPFLPELSAVVNLGMDKQDAEGSENVSNLNPLRQSDGSIIGSSKRYTNSQSNYLFDGYVRYKKRLHEFQLDITAGYSYQKFNSSRFNTNELLDDGTDSEPITFTYPEHVLIGYFGRTNLKFKDKYLLTLTYRRDGTSRFAPAYRWGNFPSAAFAWKANEDLLSDNSSISTLKLRLGWGITGQQDIGINNLLPYLHKYIKGNPVAQYQFGNRILPVGIPEFRNDNLKWEETTTYNIGVDFGLSNDRFTASLDTFRKESVDLLVDGPLPDGANFSNEGIQNVGKFTSQGIEFLLGGDIISNATNPFNWNASINASVIRTEITKLKQDILEGTTGQGTGIDVQILREDYTPYSFYVYKQVYDTEGLPIEGTYADLNGDNVINIDDRYIHHNNTPKLSLGFASNMSYKRFDLSFNLRGVIGNYVYNSVNSSRAQYKLLSSVNTVASNLPKSVLQTQFNTTENVILSDLYVENASFLRIDNVTLGYTFKSAFNANATLRLAGSVQNLLTVTNYSGLDPEVFGNGIDNTITPRPRTFLINANIRFN